MECIFRALSDPNRRKLLDSLREEDGQTLTQLEVNLNMTRFGVMKHLKLLEDASLISTRKVGRFKYHYLNPLPLKEILERWIAPYISPLTDSISVIKNQLERNKMETSIAKPKHVYETIIRTTAEKLWEALINPEHTKKYYYGGAINSSLKPGDSFNYLTTDGNIMVGGEVVEVIPQKKLVTTFTANWGPNMSKDPISRVTYEIEQLGELCKLTLLHDGFEEENETYKNTGGGWPGILSGLKTLLETGESLNFKM